MEDWDTERGIVKCSYCRAFSTLPGHTCGDEKREKSRDKNEFRPRFDMSLPHGMKMESTAHGIMLTLSWFTWAAFVLLPFCLVWNGFLVFWYGLAFRHGTPWIMILFPILHVTAGLWLIYFTLSLFFNSTRISAEGAILRIRHYPLPWPGNHVLDSKRIAQLFCMEIINRRKGNTVYSYEVWAALTDADSMKLTGGELTLEQALFIEQKLERAMGIEDRAVPGEIQR